MGDKANDAVRVDGEQLRVRVVGEGGNLGLTQRGRVEYALTGGRVNTDAIDNSAGVDTSDHEVNIKIALNRVVDAGELKPAGRATLLGEMADDVAAAVPQQQPRAERDAGRRGDLGAQPARRARAVHPQPGALRPAAAQRGGAARRPAAGRAAARRPGADQPRAVGAARLRQAAGRRTRCCTPSLPDDPALEELLVDYFPTALRKRFPAAITGHPLRREIIATALTNRAVNIAGVTGLFRLAQETGAPLARVVLAHTVARAVFDVDRLWDAVRPLDNVVSAATQVELRTEATRLAERTARWILRQPELADETAPSIAEVRDRFAAPVAAVRAGLPRLAAGRRGRGLRRAGRRGCRRPGVPAGAGRRDRRGAAAAGRAGPRRRQRAHRGARRAGRAGHAVPGRAAGPGAAARAGHRAPARPPLAVDGARLAARRPRHGAGLARRGRAGPARRPTRDPPEKLVARLGRGLGHHPGARRPRSSPTSPSGDRHELAELLVAVRTLRGLRKRRQARRLPRPEK